MVTINLTIVVEVGLFLVFVWAMNRFVFRPLLRVMDKRAARIEDDKTKAAAEVAEAEQLETRYASTVAAIHRDATHKIVEAHREAQVAHTERVATMKKKEEEELALLREEAMRQVDEERKRYPELAAALANAMAERLRLKGSGS